ncbi:MAG: hypothetical protein U0166_08870 [Acidobacteriota bacterium]
MLGAAHVYWGAIFADESFYLYASKLVASGKTLYRDFFYLQNPAFPYVYALPIGLWSSPYAGRILSLVFSVVALLATVGLARRLSNEAGAAIAAVLLGLNAFHAYFAVIVRVYAPTAAFLAIGAYLYARIRRPVVAATLAAVCFAVAVAFRLTAAPAIAGLVIALLLRRELRAAVAAAIAAAVVVALPFLPFLLVVPARILVYQAVGFHTEIRNVGGPAAMVIVKLRTLPDVAANYMLLWLALLIAVAITVGARGRAGVPALLGEGKERDLWVVALVNLAAQSVAMNVQADYYEPGIALPMALAGAALARNLRFPRPAPAALLAAGTLQALAHGTGSMDIDRHLHGPFTQLRPYVDFVRSAARPAETVMTSDSQLVPFMAGREILHGFESFEYFPSWTRERCREFGVCNDEMILELVGARVPAAILLSDYSYRKPFPISVDQGPERRQRILDRIAEGYDLGATFPSPYFQGGKSYVYVRRPGRPPGSSRAP